MHARLALALSAAVLAAAPLAAQYRNTPSLSIEASGVYTGVPTRVFPGLGDGRGAEAQVTLGIGNFAISGGVSRTLHDVGGAATLPIPGTTPDIGAQLTTFFVEPRLALPLGVSNFTPYLYGRAGQTRLQYTTDGDEIGRRTNALQLGGGIGTIIEVTKGIALNLGGGYQWHRAGNTFSDGSQPSGGGYMVRAGLLIGGTRWARDPGF
jgi:opacity protein-like surface antigen